MKRQLILCAVAFAFVVCGMFLPLSAQQFFPVYFDMGHQLTEEFQGTYEFKYRRLEFARDGAGYAVRSSGDESPRTDNIVVRNGYAYWVLGGSGEEWIALKAILRGDHWSHHLRGWNQHYSVLATDQTVSVPAGQFQQCAKVEVSWTAHEHDMSGVQKVVLYLAPHLGIIKREVWSNGEKEHEEVLTKYASR
jgi:hypothetical protein